MGGDPAVFAVATDRGSAVFAVGALPSFGDVPADLAVVLRAGLGFGIQDTLAGNGLAFSTAPIAKELARTPAGSRLPAVVRLLRQAY